MVASSIHESKVPGSNPGADTLTFRFRLNADRVTSMQSLSPFNSHYGPIWWLDLHVLKITLGDVIATKQHLKIACLPSALTRWHCDQFTERDIYERWVSWWNGISL